MKAKYVLEKIADNWIAKVFCLIAAIVVFMLHQTSVMSRKTFSIPLNVVADGVVAPIDGNRDFVRVSVRTSSDHISLASEDTVTAELNLNTYTQEGKYTVPVKIKLAPELYAVEPLEVRVIPEYVAMLLERKFDTYIAIDAAVTGTPAAGYSVTGVSVSPSTIFVTGPHSIVSAVARIPTEKIDVTGANQSRRVTTRLHNDNPLLKVDTSSEIVVEYKIEPTPLTRRFSNVPVSVRNLASGFAVTEEISPVSFDLNGTELALANYELDANVAYIDCSDITAPGVYDLPIDFYLPRGVTVSELNADIINVAISYAPEDASGTD